MSRVASIEIDMLAYAYTASFNSKPICMHV